MEGIGQLLVIPAKLVEDMPTIGLEAVAVYCALRYAGDGASVNQLADICGISASAASQAARILESFEYIKGREEASA
jgi:hypothetical protein